MSRIKFWILVMGMMILWTSCGKKTETGETDGIPITDFVDTGFVVTDPESYDSADTPLIIGINQNEGTITFLNLTVGKKYTLHIDGTTKLYDKYGAVISLAQIKEGDIVDVTFLKSKKHLVSMKLSAKAWKYENVEKYEINSLRKEVTIGDEVFKLTDNTQYLSGNRLIELMDLNSADVLSFQGIDTTIMCVTVQKGHGYLRLTNAESFVGGWIELGQKQIHRITEDMLLTVPEGSYQVSISHKGNGGIRNVVINRDEETNLDIGDMKVAEPQKGTVLFSVTPSQATVYIDGTETDISQPVILEYGLHQLIVRASGYQSLTKYLRVAEESAGINIELDKETVEETTDSTSTSSSSVSGNSASATSPVGSSASESSTSAAESSSASESGTSSESIDTATKYYKVYIDAPEKAEVYLDGNYVGIAPLSFKKVAGTHVIILRRSGYETRSYTIQVDNEDRDVTYSFADLEVSTSVYGSMESLLSEAISSILNN